jgi:hypothetical protein
MHPHIEVTSWTKDSPMEELVADRLQCIWQTLQAEMTRAQECQSEQANKHRSAQPLL